MLPNALVFIPTKKTGSVPLPPRKGRKTEKCDVTELKNGQSFLETRGLSHTCDYQS